MTTTLRTSSILLLWLALSTSLWATQWTVDNSPNSPGQFTSLQAAIDSAAAGDTLLITGTNINYGAASVTKPLTLIGAGYFPNEPETITDQITLLSSNVHVTGIRGSVHLDLENADGDTLANITLTRCRLGLQFSASSQAGAGRLIDIDVYNNVIDAFGMGGCSAPNMRFDSVLVANNITRGFGFNGNCMPQFQGTETFIIDHNLFIGASGGCTFGNQSCGIFTDQYGPPAWPNSMAILSNNIFHLQEVGGIRGCGQCSWYNNMTYCPDCNTGNDSIPGTPAGNENQWVVNPQLVNYTGGNFSWAHDYSLMAGSPAIGAASDNESDIGPFDGPYPFTLGLPPAVPVVDFVNLSRTAVPQDSTIFLQFDAKVRP